MNLLTNLLHALRKPTTGTTTRQTDSAKIANSGDSRERPAFDFDWNSIVPPSALAVEKFCTATDEETRNFPLAVALQVHDSIEENFTRPETGGMSSLAMAEHRGGIKALKTFAKLYSQAVFKK